MPVLTHCVDLSLNYQKLYQFLLASQQNCPRTCTQIVSISLDVAPTDPLVVLEKMAQPNQLAFYFENKNKKEAIAAIDAAAVLQLAGKNRFNQAQSFVKSCLKNTDILSTTDHRFAGPHFFCSFSFFNQTYQANYPFSSASVFLPRWQLARQGDRCVLVANLAINSDTNLKAFIQQLWHKIQIISSLEGASKEIQNSSQDFFKKDVASLDEFKQSVLQCSDLIKANQLNKIVLAHAIDVTARSAFNLFQCLNNLRELYPDCYVFSFGNSKGQNFIGASPERLISVRDRQLLTDALAGSISRGKTIAEDAELAQRLLHSEKERREHQVVIDFITHYLQQLGIVPQLLPPRLRQLANIQHLWTPIQATVPSNVHPLEIVAALHPTPAVGGDGRNIACAGIRRLESFERG